MPRPTVWHRLNQELRTKYIDKDFFYYYLLFQHNKHEQNIYSNTIKITYIHLQSLVFSHVCSHTLVVLNFQISNRLLRLLLLLLFLYTIFFDIFMFMRRIRKYTRIEKSKKTKKKMKVKVKENNTFNYIHKCIGKIL